MVYEKSARGYTEFTNNKRTLNVRERQVLLLVNGIRDLDDLEKFFKKEHLMETLEKLEAGGFIQPTKAYSSATPAITETATNSVDAPTSPILTASPAADFSVASLTTMSFFQTENVNTTVNAATIEAVKTILVEATDDYLGLMGRAIRARISACDNETELRNCISSWHMAMRESKLGRESTSFLLQQIHHALEGNPELGDSAPSAAVTTASPTANVININVVETTNHVKATDTIPTLANLQSASDIEWSAQPNLAQANLAQHNLAQPKPMPAQQVNALEPLGFLQSAFG
jgi:hypothetical protein